METNASLYVLKCEPIKQKGVPNEPLLGKGSLKQLMEIETSAYISSSILFICHGFIIIIILLLFGLSLQNAVSFTK